MTAFEALPPSWTALRSLRKLNFDYSGPPLEAEHALRPLGSWTQLTSLKFYDGFGVHLTPGNLEQQLTRLSALQHLHIGSLMMGVDLPPGQWQGQLTSLRCNLWELLPEGWRAGPFKMNANSRDLTASQHSRSCTVCWAALPALELVLLLVDEELRREVHESHTALGSPLGARLEFNCNPYVL